MYFGARKDVHLDGQYLSQVLLNYTLHKFNLWLTTTHADIQQENSVFEKEIF